MEEYVQTRSELKLLPGMPECCADMDDLYIELDLLEEEKTYANEVKIKRKLKSADELFTLRGKRGKHLKRILVRGGPGSGKSTVISKLAYDWAHEKVIPNLPDKIHMLFALDVRAIQKGSSLTKAIQDQLLPRSPSHKLKSYIESHAKSIVFLLDGFDEASDVLQHKDFYHLLSSKWLQESIVIVTTRQNKVAQFVDTYGLYSQIQLRGFSQEHIKEYVLRFLQVELYSEYITININYLRSYRTTPYIMCEYFVPVNVQEKVKGVVSFLNDLVTTYPDLCDTPLTLSMMCLMSKKDKELLTQKRTDLYSRAILHLAKHKQVKQRGNRLDIESIQEKLDNVMIAIGKVALDGLIEDRLNFSTAEFDEKTLDDACQFALLTIERKRSEEAPIQHVTFYHKTFQEFCAAIYWSSLIKKDWQKFMSFWEQIKTVNVRDMKVLFQFTCGKSIEAATVILPYIVRLSHEMIKSDPVNVFHDMILPEDPRVLFPVALLYETGAQHLHRHLLPLFDWPSSLRLSHICFNMHLKAFIFFIHCLLSDAESLDSMWKTVTKVTVTNGDKHPQLPTLTQLYLSLLSRLPALKSLTLEYIDGHVECGKESFLNGLVETYMSNKSIITSLSWFIFTEHQCRLPSQTLQTMAAFMNQLKSLNTLNFSSLPMGDVTYLLNALDINIKVCELTIESSIDCLNCKLMSFDSLCKFLPFLHKLELQVVCDESVWEKLFISFATVGRQLRSKPSLLTSNTVEGEAGIDETVHLPCERLVLEHIAISESAGRKLVESFEYLGNLQEFCVSGAEFDVCDTIKKHILKLPNLTVLDLSGSNNPIVENMDSDSGLCHNLRYLTKLTHLSLMKTGLTSRHLKELKVSLKNMSQLQVLKLEENQLSTGIVDLCQGLQFLTNLVKLCLALTGLNEEGVSHITSCLVKMPDLQTLRLSFNKIGNAMGDLCHGLQYLRKLRKLQLVNTDITDVGLSKLPLEYLTDLRTLEIAGHSQQYGPNGVEHLFKNLHHTKNLERLSLCYSEEWCKRNLFLRQCFQKCIRMHPNNVNPIVSLDRLTIQAVVAFVQTRFHHQSQP